MALPRSPETWLIRFLLPIGGTLLVYGDPKVGKSYFVLQLCAALQNGGEFLGFPVVRRAKVAYIQLDTPRGIWADRVEELRRGGFQLPGENLYFEDRETLGLWPFDILNPAHAAHLKRVLSADHPDVVVIDTIRAAHSGKENDSDVMQNVMNQLTAAVQPAALIIVSHAKKVNPEHGRSLLDDNRGSTAVTGAVDTIMTVRKKSIVYQGRAIEEGTLKISRLDNGLWETDQAEVDGHVERILADGTLTSLRAKARRLAELTSKSEEACRSLLRRR